MSLQALISDNAKIGIRALLSKMGVEIGAYKGSFAQHRAKLLDGEAIATVWDLGAHVGQFGARLLSNGYRGGIVSVEPSPSAFAELSRRSGRHPRWTAVEVAISDVAGPVTLHLSANGQSSSLLTMEQLHVVADPKSRPTGTQVVQSMTLDRLQSSLAMSPPFFVKLDLQGGELAALRGATTVLSCTSVCEVELSLADLYRGQSQWQEVVALLGSAGLTICDIERVFAHPRSGDLLQVNALLRRVK